MLRACALCLDVFPRAPPIVEGLRMPVPLGKLWTKSTKHTVSQKEMNLESTKMFPAPTIQTKETSESHAGPQPQHRSVLQ